MILQDNILKEYLRNVYFITGTPCGGKTTISQMLAKKHHFVVYNIDEMFPIHQKMSDVKYQPSMNQNFQNADEFFGRPVEKYWKWLVDNTREQLDFVLLDLIRLSQNQIVICDCHLTVEDAERLTDAARIVFLLHDPTHLIDEYCNRLDHLDFYNFIHSSTDVEKAKMTCNETLKLLNTEYYQKIKSSSYFWLERKEDSTVDATLHSVEQHFHWDETIIPNSQI